MQKDRPLPPDTDRILRSLVVRNRLARMLVILMREVERLREDNGQLRAAVGFYQEALKRRQDLS